MNNDAKDVIGNLRPLNIVLILLRVRDFEFPLDRSMKSRLEIMKGSFLEMLSVDSDLAHFGDRRIDLTDMDVYWSLTGQILP
jgi:hypothetical protein